jgi:PIN domain nuclease of toxin-antitoxin system
VKILVDTHIFLWAIADEPPPFGRAARDIPGQFKPAVQTDASGPSASYLFGQMEKNRVEMLTIRPSNLSELESLPPLHRAPFDRMMLGAGVSGGNADPVSRPGPAAVSRHDSVV